MFLNYKPNLSQLYFSVEFFTVSYLWQYVTFDPDSGDLSL